MKDNAHNDKLKSSAIIIGQELAMNVYAKNGLLLLKRGHYVLTPDMKAKLVNMGYTDQKIEAKPVEKPDLNDHKTQSLFDEVMFLHQRVRNLLHNALRLPQLEQRVRAIAADIITLSERNPDGLIAALLLLPFQEYSPAHAAHTASLLALLTGRLRLPAGHRETLLCAALTMNISKLELHNALFAQQEQPHNDQRELINAHPLLSSAILREAGIEDELWHTLVQSHHENWQGTGYPYGLPREQILPPAHLLHLADIVCAKLTPRRYRPAQLPAAALGNVFTRKDVDFDANFTAMLIRELGVYPPGSFVKLASNEIAVVLQRRPHRPSEPLVAALRKVDGPAYGQPLLRETFHAGYKITGPCTVAQAGVRISFLAGLWKA
ncbi:HD domain-containing phosphohydrolase [uncultured Aquitalea sp.]|uniref:HD-GYP domain-containing protein n=1 Tax=uncultured Aquitalea sp. TaxID=540272 RepID=UPI0025F1D6E4|nr:HD domain-containing phosphohydrolase [uncultured Aquitalea sp.]